MDTEKGPSPLTVTCPRKGCEAKPGEPCRNVSGRFTMPRNEYHPTRVREAHHG